MEAGDQGGGGGGEAEGTGGRGRSGGPDGREGPEGPGGEGAREAGAAAAGSPRAAEAPPAPGPSVQGASEVGAQAGPAAGASGRQMFQFFLSVPFSTRIEAEMAHRIMTRCVRLQGPVRKEITVSGNRLAIRMTTEDPEQLRISVISCLKQLSMLLRIMQRFVPLIFPMPKVDKGG